MRLICFTLLFLIANQMLAQIDIIPKIASSPEISLLGKFDNIPVSNYTGVPEISIPIYTIKVDNLEIPIVLRYNSSGIKVEEEATWVGLGWDLTVGGNITQIPIGEFDQADHPSSYQYDKLMYNDVQGLPGFNSFTSRYERGYAIQEASPMPDYYDDPPTFRAAKSFGIAQPDNYNYLIPGSSGKFYMDPKTDFKKAILMGNIKNKVFITNIPNNIGFANWQIKDMNGISYSFNSKDLEITTNNSGKISNSGYANVSTLSWKLSNISLPSGRQVIFNYLDGQFITVNNSQTYTKYNTQPSIGSNGIVNTTLVNTVNCKYLSVVETDNERIEFILSDDSKNERSDLLSNFNNNKYTAKRLNSINIIDKIQNRIVKTYKFSYSFYNTNNGQDSLSYYSSRLKLNSVQEIGYNIDGTQDLSKSPYIFTYNENYPLPKKNSYAIDYWGYYNGQNSNLGSLPNLCENIAADLIHLNNLPPEVISDIYNFSNSNRGMDPKYAISGLLSSIKYPTGGYTNFIYEPNEFLNYPVLSAQDIISQNSFSKGYEVIDTKSCDTPNPKKTELISPDKYGILIIGQMSYSFSLGYNNPNDPTRPLITASNFDSAYFRLMKVNTDGNDTELMRHNFDVGLYNASQTGGYTLIINDRITFTGSPNDKYYMEASLGSKMPCVSSTIPSAVVSCNFTVPNSNIVYGGYKSIGGGMRVKAQESYNANGKMVLKRSYKYVLEDGITSSGKLMSGLNFYSYQDGMTKVGPGAKVLNYIFSISSSSNIPLAYDANGAVVGYDRVETSDVDSLNNTLGTTVYHYYNTPSKPAYSFVSSYYNIPSLPYEYNGLVSYLEIKDHNNKLVKKTNYTYKSIKDTLGYGVKIISHYFGAEDAANACCNWTNNQCNRYEFAYYPLQTRWYVLDNTTDILFPSDISDTNQVSITKTYAYNGLGQTISESLTGSDKNIYSTTSLYPYDDKSGDALVAKMVNKGLYSNLLNQFQFKNSNIQISSKKLNYLENPNGNIKVNSLTQSNLVGAVYNPIKEVLYDSKDNVTQVKQNETYMSFIWSYNQIYPVVKIEGKANVDIPQAIRDTITNHAFSRLTDHVNVNADMSWLKKQLSTLLKDKSCMVTFYTYSPLIGMTSQTGPSGVTTYYEYDSFGRLQYIKDDDGRILKSYEYHYKQ